MHTMLFGISYDNTPEDEYELEEFEGLEAAKEAAEQRIKYTQSSLVICDDNGATITRAEWFDREPASDEPVLFEINGGFYRVWNDEL